MKSIIILLLVCFPAIVDAQVKSDLSFKIPYEKQCGHPAKESNFFAEIGGQVQQIKVTETISIIFMEGKQKRKVTLAAIAPFSNKRKVETRQFLADLLLDKSITISVNPSKMDDTRFVGLVRFKDEDVSLKLIESGNARYKEPSNNEMSLYGACVYRIVEEQAQTDKRGFWKEHR